MDYIAIAYNDEILFIDGPIGRFGSGSNLALGPVQLMVRVPDQEQAMKLIEQHYGKDAANIDIPEEEWSAEEPEGGPGK